MARTVDHLPALTEKFFGHVAAGEEELAMGMIHPKVRKELPWDTISEVWRTCVEEHGALEKFSGTFITHPGGTADDDGGFTGMLKGKMMGLAVGVTTLEQEAGEIMGRVAFDRDDAIVGVLYLTTDAAKDQIAF